MKELKTMTVGELIEQLQGIPVDTKVCFEKPSHDYNRNLLAGRIHEVGEASVKWSEYHQGYKIVECYEDEKQGTTEQVIILA